MYYQSGWISFVDGLVQETRALVMELRVSGINPLIYIKKHVCVCRCVGFFSKFPLVNICIDWEVYIQNNYMKSACTYMGL